MHKELIGEWQLFYSLLFKIMSGTIEAMIPSHVDEFMFRDWMDLAVDWSRCFPTII